MHEGVRLERLVKVERGQARHVEAAPPLLVQVAVEVADPHVIAVGNFVLLVDAGLTQIPAGTITVLGIGPVAVEKLEKVVGKLKLV